MNRAVIFDLDGTLLDTLGDISDNVNKMLARFGFDTLCEREIMSYIGNGARELVRRCLKRKVPENELDEYLAYYNEIYTNSASVKTGLFKGIGEVLETLKKREYKLAILTNKPQATTDRVYEKYLKSFDFDAVVGQSKAVRCKPDKTAALNILKVLEVPPSNAFFVGDGETDVLTGINAGICGIAVLWGYRTREELSAAGAEIFAEKPADLLKFIN